MATSIHPHGYWLGNPKHLFDRGLFSVLVRIFKPTGGDVLDLGCGCQGLYVKALREAGVHCNGLDGSPNTAVTTHGMCGVADLTKPLVDVPVHDWVLCLEVGEHIPEKFEKTVIENIHNHNRNGVVLSWAVEGQGGNGHVNCRNNDYIKGIFKNLGYTNDPATEHKMRRAVTNCPWFKNTAMMFRRY